MMFDLILTIIALTALIIATISDIKTKEIPDYLSYSIIAIALFIRLVYSLLRSDYNLIISPLIILFVMYALGSLMFYTRQWGGGDTKLLIALSAIFATNIRLFEFTKLNNIPYIITFIFNILIAGSIYSLIYIFILAIKNRKNFIENYRKISKDKKIITIKWIVFISLLITVLLSVIFGQIMIIYIFSTLVLVIFFYISLIAKSVENTCMFKLIPVNKLVEGDWIAKQVRYKNKILASPKDLYVTKKQIQLLKKYKIKKVLIKDGIAFAPAFLIGTIITLTLGNLLFWII